MENGQAFFINEVLMDLSKEKRYRLLWMSGDGNECWWIDLDGKKRIPEPVTSGELEIWAASGRIVRAEDPVDMMPMNEGQKSRAMRRYDVIAEAVKKEPEIYRPGERSALLEEVAEKQGWDLDTQPWLVDMANTAFSYSRAAHDNGMEIPAGSYYFREAEVIGIQAMERILPLITENDDRAELCEYLAMAYARSMDRVKVLQEAEKNPQVKKYLTMMEKMDSDYKILYDHAVEEGEKRAAIVKNLQINQDILKAGIEQMTINMESLDRRIRNLQKGFFYALNVFDWINEKKLKKERDNLQEKIARNKYNLTELEKRIAQLV